MDLSIIGLSVFNTNKMKPNTRGLCIYMCLQSRINNYRHVFPYQRMPNIDPNEILVSWNEFYVTWIQPNSFGLKTFEEKTKKNTFKMGSKAVPMWMYYLEKVNILDSNDDDVVLFCTCMLIVKATTRLPHYLPRKWLFPVDACAKWRDLSVSVKCYIQDYWCVNIQ